MDTRHEPLASQASAPTPWQHREMESQDATDEGLGLLRWLECQGEHQWKEKKSK